jgi:hypothetical protein
MMRLPLPNHSTYQKERDFFAKQVKAGGERIADARIRNQIATQVAKKAKADHI